MCSTKAQLRPPLQAALNGHRRAEHPQDHAADQDLGIGLLGSLLRRSSPSLLPYQLLPGWGHLPQPLTPHRGPHLGPTQGLCFPPAQVASAG